MSLDAVIALAQYEFGADPDLRCYYCGKPVSGDFGTLKGDPICEDDDCDPIPAKRGTGSESALI